MNDREKLSKLFEDAAQALLEISRIMANKSGAERKESQKEYAIRKKREDLELKSKDIIRDLSKPFPETNPKVHDMIGNLVEKL